MPVSNVPTPFEQLLEIAVNKKKISIGLPMPSVENDRRFPLTPEAAGMLAGKGYTVKMQAGGARSIHYGDSKYREAGVEIVSRADALRCDIVISLSHLDPADARLLRRGALLLTFKDAALFDPLSLKCLLKQNIVTIALDLVADDKLNHPFSDILAEISGRAAISVASALLADSIHGKGILLGGIAGIVPCEVTILGSGIDACAAACSAIGLGATVRMFDNDVYRLRSALRGLGPGVSGSAMHPRVLQNALKSADVVVVTEIKPLISVSSQVIDEMKLGVIMFDLNNSHYSFPSLPAVDLGAASATDNTMEGDRVCYVNPGNAVPRTSAMALSNTFLTMFNDLFSFDGFSNALMLDSGLQCAALTFMGHAVHLDVAKLTGTRHFDIKLLLQFS